MWRDLGCEARGSLDMFHSQKVTQGFSLGIGGCAAG